MTKTNYSEKLANPLWQRKRLEIFQRDNWRCTKCKSEIRSLHVHHIRYINGLEPWEYENHFLTTLCQICHKNEHEIIIDSERKYEHLILYKEEPIGLNRVNVQIHQLQDKLKESISEELQSEILKNIMFLQQSKKEYFGK